MTAIAQALTAALLQFVWQGLLITVLLWVALWALRNRRADLLARRWACVHYASARLILS